MPLDGSGERLMKCGLMKFVGAKEIEALEPMITLVGCNLSAECSDNSSVDNRDDLLVTQSVGTL